MLMRSLGPPNLVWATTEFRCRCDSFSGLVSEGLDFKVVQRSSVRMRIGARRGLRASFSWISRCSASLSRGHAHQQMAQEKFCDRSFCTP